MTIEEARRHMERRELGVVYRPAHGEPEYGEITNVNDRYVFVRYRGTDQARATDPADLTLLAADARTARRAAFRQSLRGGGDGDGPA